MIHRVGLVDTRRYFNSYHFFTKRTFAIIMNNDMVPVVFIAFNFMFLFLVNVLTLMESFAFRGIPTKFRTSAEF